MQASQNILERASKMVRVAILLIAVGVEMQQTMPAGVLVPRGSTWKFLDDGTDQGTLWRNLNFVESGWKEGAAQLGYGDNDEWTTVSYGPSSTNKYITTYFRKSFEATGVETYHDLTLSLLRDDGVVVCLNGREVFRSNLPGGVIGYRTLALANIGGADETNFVCTIIPATNLINGVNVIAVEIHQAAVNSTDISFDLQLVANPWPVRIEALSPPNSARGVNCAANLSVAVRDVTSSNTVTIYGRPAGPSPGPDFTIVALPDTQCYVSAMNGGQPQMFRAQTDWIVAQKAAANIVFVTQLGDCVEHGDTYPIEWQHATNAMYQLEDPVLTLAAEGIPYGVAVGNHDQSPIGTAAGTTRFYNQYFGEAHFAGRAYYGGHYGTNNDNHFELFSASGLDFVVVHVEFDPAQDTNVLAWVNTVLETYRDRRAILVSHFIITTGASFGPQGQKLYDGLKHNANLFLMLSGHDPGESRRTDTSNGNTIHTVIADYQGRTNGGSGFLRLLEFSPSNNVIRVKTYSPTFGQFETDTDSEFTLDYNMRGGPAFTVLGSFTGVCTETNLATAWAGLLPNTSYEWYAEATDGTAGSQSAIWQFRTTAPAGAPPLRLNLTRHPSGQMMFSWTTMPGSVYQLVYRDDLTNGNWTVATPELTATGATFNWTLANESIVPQRFFAVKMVR